MKKYLGFISATFLLVEGFGVGAAIAGDKYGAVATGSDGAYGYAYNYNSKDEAIDAALAQCGSSCTAKVWFANACGAVAKGGNAVGWAWDASEAAAKQNAIDSCHSYGGSSCEVAVWACTDR